MASKIQVRLYPQEAEALGIKAKASDPGRKTTRYNITQEQKDSIPRLDPHRNARDMTTTIEKLDRNGKITSTTRKLQAAPIEVPEGFEIIKVSENHSSGQQWIQYAPKDPGQEVKEIDFEAIVKKHIKPVKLKVSKVKTRYLFDRLVYTDLHIGMTPNEKGFSQYGGKWDEAEIELTRKALVSHVLKHKKSNTLIIDELGDFMDGWDGETVRKGHKLPKNMDNEKAYDIGVSFKVRLIDQLAPYYEKIIAHNICEDNHAGSFGYVVNSAFKRIVELKYPNVEVINFRRFINHYKIGKYCFILSHGKDSKNLKFGFKPVLDATQAEKISNYIDDNYLMAPGVHIEFSKGDSHQDILDSSTSDKFNYFNYPALSPSSEWVQVNFKKGRRGFYFFNYEPNGERSLHPKYFKWKKTSK